MISLIKKKGVNPQTKATLYFPQWTRVATTDAKELAKRMARNSTFSVGEISGMFQDFPENIIDELLAGNAVQIDGLGSFKLKVSGKSRANIEDVTSQGATISVVFEPDENLTSRLNDEKTFHFVTKPTEEGEQDVNDTTGDDDNQGTQTGGGDSSDPSQDLEG